jgi:hypothetical protein
MVNVRVDFRDVPLWRGILARKPSADFFGGLADFGEWQAVMEIAGIWDPASAGPTGSLAGLPRAQWVSGPGSIYLMGPFAFRQPGRFGDGSFGVLYAALEEPTAIAELAAGHARFLRKSHAGRETIDNLVLRLSVTGELEDLRALFAAGHAIYNPDDWSSAQALAAGLRAAGACGIAYASVRRLGGECVAGFRPDLFSGCRPGGTVQLHWDGKHMLGPGGLLA